MRQHEIEGRSDEPFAPHGQERDHLVLKSAEALQVRVDRTQTFHLVEIEPFDALDMVQIVAREMFIGDTIHTVVTISEKRGHKKRDDRGVLTEHLEIVNQRDEIVMVADHLLMCEKRPSA